MLGDIVICGTARLFVACYVGRLFVDAAGVRSDASLRTARILWTSGAVLALAHMAAAFQWKHHWSHSAAYEHVLVRTREMIGFESGAGLYVNYAFTLLWLTDAAIWWWNLRWPDRTVPYWCVQTAFAFLMFQATAVFGPAFWKPIAIAVITLLIILRRSAVRIFSAPVDYHN